jgi:hypothetical protein
MKTRPAAGSAPLARTLEDWLAPGRFALLLGVLIVASFPRVVTGSGAFFFRDYSLFTYPLAFYHCESFWRGELPLWNPFSDCGLPFLAQWNTLTLYPLSLVYLLLPLPWSLGMFSLLHLWLGGMGMYFLARHWTGSRLAGAVGGIIFGFNGLTWYSLMWTSTIAALGWMPWVILAMDLAWRHGGRAVAVAGLAGAMQMLAGAPEVILLTWLALGAFWLLRMWEGEAPRSHLCLRFIAAWALVVALAAVQLFPFLDLVRNSQRGTSFGDTQWSMPLTGCLNYLVPLFHLQRSPGTPYYQQGQVWIGSYYLGVGAMLAALLAVCRVRSGRVWVLAVMVVFSVLLAMGGNAPLYPLLRALVPLLGLIRFPIKGVVLATFAIPALAAHGIAWLESAPDDGRQKVRRSVIWLGCALLACIGLVALAAWKGPQSAGVGDASYDMAGTLWNAATRGGFLVVMTACLAGLRVFRAGRMPVILGVAVLVVQWLDVLTHCPDLSPTMAASAYDPDQARVYLARRGQLAWPGELAPGVSRAMPTPGSLAGMTSSMLDNPAVDIAARRLAFFDDCNLLDHAAKVDGFFPLYLREADAITTWLYTTTNRSGPLKDFLAVSIENGAVNPCDWSARGTALPMITTGQRPVFTVDSEAFREVVSDQFEPGKVVYLPLRAGSLVTARGGTPTEITNEEFSAQRVSADVTASASAMVVIAQAYYHDWRAYLDGRSVPLWPANYAYQAVEVPAGRHHLALVYEDSALHWGIAVSLAGLLACEIVMLRTRRAHGQPVT